jgi:hypothetical protein
MKAFVFESAIIGWAIEFSILIWFLRQMSKSSIQKVIRVTVLAVFIAVSSWYSYHWVDEIRQSYQGEDKTLQKTPIGGEDAAHKNACEQMMKQSEQLQSWSVLILGAIVAILVTTKAHRIKNNFGWPYLVLAPAAVFLAGSLNGGRAFSKRFAYIVAKNNFDIKSLSSLLEIQQDLFLYSIICVSVFAGVFLLLIVLERVEPFEEK